MPTRRGHGFWGYLVPFFTFLVIVQFKSRLPASWAGVLLALQVALPAALFLGFAARGAYPELRGFRLDATVALDVAVGLAGAAIWVAPFVGVDAWRPQDAGAFDPAQMGPSRVWLALLVRGVGYGVVTPVLEELFMRSWLLRYAEVFDRRRDFRDVPVAHFSWRSLAIVLVFFVGSHVPWEWPVMFAWALGTMLWFYHRKHIVPLILVHAVTNLAIFGFVVVFDGRLLDGAGRPISLWFFI
jgi:CAAX prenyl protease-like protein